MTRSLRDCVSREVERALMRDVVVRISSSPSLVLGEGEGGVEFDSEDSVCVRGPMDGMGEEREFMVMSCFCRRDARRVRLASERALPERQRAPVMQYFRTLTVILV
jgi:hypothetical protein